MLLRDTAEAVAPPESGAPLAGSDPRPSTSSGRPEPLEGRKRFLDNPRVIATAVALLIGLLAGLGWLSERTGTGEIVSPLLSDVLLYVLYAVDLTILAALVFVLARNLVKVWVEQRRAAPFARLRPQLVGPLPAMPLLPPVPVRLTGRQA